MPRALGAQVGLISKPDSKPRLDPPPCLVRQKRKPRLRGKSDLGLSAEPGCQYELVLKVHYYKRCGSGELPWHPRTSFSSSPLQTSSAPVLGTLSKEKRCEGCVLRARRL